ncbi:MAG: Fe-S cluster assembly protein SufB, partial [Chloroflexi bacterium]
YYVLASDKRAQSWEDVPSYVKDTFDKLGIPQAEQKYLAGVGAQYDCLHEETLVHTSDGLKPIKAVEPGDIVFSYDDSLNEIRPARVEARVPKGPKPVFEVKVGTRRIRVTENHPFLTLVDARRPGRLRRRYRSNTLHSAVVEIIVQKDADVRYTTIQNWSHNVYNLVTKRAVVQEGGRMTWIDANLGSKVTMKYPSVYLVGERAHGEVLSVAFAGNDQHQDAGAKMIHAAPNTTSIIQSKGISKGTGQQTYRGMVKIYPGAHGAKSTVRCDALILDPTARSDTYPYMEVDEEDVTIGHEASVSKVGEEQLFYLMSRGLSEAEGTAMVVNGFIEPIVKTLPMDYAIEMNRLITLQMQGAIG